MPIEWFMDLHTMYKDGTTIPMSFINKYYWMKAEVARLKRTPILLPAIMSAL